MLRKRRLNFVPGIGALDERFMSGNAYVLGKPVTVKLGSGTLTVTGISSPEVLVRGPWTFRLPDGRFAAR
ncbi:hypothetical protein ACFQWB_15390 [Paenibacillus thermoaerophilus]|uniref:Uncharacterized protein n=1 Tax=Paenibacillus thermoaerophilus TaxID=1215385 RepID=A0ABW2V585_9BACL|nr:hypothetical protein FE781_05400 [Paenibacillus thermoaerophilus]